MDRDRFSAAVSFVLRHKGGMVVDRDDQGGITKYGISQRSYPGLDIAELTIEQAKEIYLADYWRKLQANRLPCPLDLLMFDTAVNCGVNRTVRWLQEEVNGQLERSPLAVDGVLGERTVQSRCASVTGSG